MEEIKTKNLPLIALRGMVAFPDTITNLDIAREKSLAALNAAPETVLLVPQKKAEIANPKISDLNGVGTLVSVKQIFKNGDNMKVLVAGEKRVIISNVTDDNDCFRADYTELEETENEPVKIEALLRIVKGQFSEYIKKDNNLSKESILNFFTEEDSVKIVNVLATTVLKSFKDKLVILNTLETSERLERLIEFFGKELQIMDIESGISAKVRESVEKNQKEYYLREQMKAISEELGDGQDDECEDYAKKIKSLKITDKDTNEKLKKEIARLKKLPENSPDSGIIRTYLDWILDIPWNTETKDNLDINAAKAALDSDHYGMTKVKERILEFLSVRAITENSKGSILCLVGPPGVGKTSIAKSVAKALNRNFVRMSLGGIKDESEIRGHRRTYVGAMPGRIIYNMRNSKSINPVFLLDEIDKMTADFRGDPASALLEVLDPEINATFRDNFIEVPYDLSKVFFITTANSLDGIPLPLLDRMEIIELSGYTMQEKTEIAKRYLVKKGAENCGLADKDISFTDNALGDIISYYTRESGVRNLEREINDVYRKIALKYLENKAILDNGLVIDKDVEKYLGAKKYFENEISKTDSVGTCIGLAWTSVGGTTLNVEATVMSGKGEVILTGKLGDVMKESARAAISYIHAFDSEFGVDDKAFSEKDIHLHVPEGAIPKDGPSAGITIATAILSALTGKPVKHNVAMTGEITLRGNVLPIGGLKEKILAAVRAGIDTIIIPKENERDLEEIPEDILKTVTVIPVKTVKEVFSKVF